MEYLTIVSAVSPGECAALARLATGKTVLEIGSYLGRSTIAMATTARQVMAVDWHRGDAHNGYGDSACEFLSNLGRHGVRDRVVPVIGRSQDVGALLMPVFDFSFVDGFHGYDETLEYIDLCCRLVRPGGLIAFHDYFDRDSFRVRSAVDSRFPALVDLVESLAVVRVPANGEGA